MALPSTSTNFLPILKYDARTGKFIRRDRIQAPDGNWLTEEEDVALPFAFVADFQSLEIGWVSFKPTPPDFRLIPFPLDNQLQGIPPNVGPRPSQDHRMTFRLLVLVRFTSEPEVRHFSHGAISVYRAFSALHDVFLASEKANNISLSPVLQVAETTLVKGKGGSAYAPVFKIAKWVDRPEVFNDHLPVAEQEQDGPPAEDPNDLPFN